MHPQMNHEMARLRMEDMQREGEMARLAGGRRLDRRLPRVSALWAGLRHLRMESKAA